MQINDKAVTWAWLRQEDDGTGGDGDDVFVVSRGFTSGQRNQIFYENNELIRERSEKQDSDKWQEKVRICSMPYVMAKYMRSHADTVIASTVLWCECTGGRALFVYQVWAAQQEDWRKKLEELEWLEKVQRKELALEQSKALAEQREKHRLA
jgi:hypothetical protein